MMFGLDQTCSVYTPHATTGAYTVLAKSNLACRLAYVEQGGSAIGDERAPIGTKRRLLWSEDYTMPDNAQVLVDGQRWNVKDGTYGALRGPGSAVVYRRCEVVEAI